MSKIEIYKSKNGETQIEVQFDNDTIWLNQQQISELFNTERTSITKHLNNIFKIGELDKNDTCAKFAQVQIEGNKKVNRNILHYNLDVIISVGYRVNSIEGTKFRQWATKRLKEYLIEGYSINKIRLEQLQKTIELIESSSKIEDLSVNETKGLLKIINSYTQSFILLNQFDSNNLSESNLSNEIVYEIKYEDAIIAIKKLKTHLISKNEATTLFGNEKDSSFEGILGNILQSFDGDYLYSTIEEQAAHLLYFIIKNHPFSDGNKRIGAFMFIWFLEKNKHRFKKNGELKINDNALVALALVVARSNPSEKEIIIKLILNLINN
jgi:death-on-curing family protein